MGTRVINTEHKHKQLNTVQAVYHGLGLATAPTLETVTTQRQEIEHTPDDENSAITAPTLHTGALNPA